MYRYCIYRIETYACSNLQFEQKMLQKASDDSAGNNEQNSNWPVGRYSGPLVDIFGSTEPWTHALSEGFQREKLNLNVLGSKIEICAQNSAFLRKKVHTCSDPKNLGAQATHRRSNYMAKVALGGTNNVPKAKKSLGPMSHTCANLQKPGVNGKSDCGRTGHEYGHGRHDAWIHTAEV